MTISEFSKTDFSAFYGLPVPFEVIQLGAHETQDVTGRSGGYVLVIGNDFHHKATARAVSELRGAAEVVALGGKNSQATGGIRWLSSGTLSRSAIAELTMERPSSLPQFLRRLRDAIVDAIASGIPVVALTRP